MKRKTKKTFIITILVLLIGLFTSNVYAADPVVTIYNGITVTHYSERQYDSEGYWRALAWTTAVKNGSNQNHYTRARIYNGAVIKDDSGRVYGYGKVYATTHYWGHSIFDLLRSYWGLA